MTWAQAQGAAGGGRGRQGRERPAPQEALISVHSHHLGNQVPRQEGGQTAQLSPSDLPARPRGFRSPEAGGGKSRCVGPAGRALRHRLAAGRSSGRTRMPPGPAEAGGSQMAI